MSQLEIDSANVTLETPRRGCCRFCGTELQHTFVDLGMSPPCESFVRAEEVENAEVFHPLHVRVCAECLLVQLPECVAPEDIFDDYAYFSSYSDSWLRHAKSYCDTVVERFQLDASRFVVEVASNDGYLLRNFVERGIPCLGIEPSSNVAAAAREHGVPSEVRFFGRETAIDVAGTHGNADLIVANNVFAHVPDINDFTAGFAALLAPTGVLTLEFPHLARLIEENQYDTIYHEHYSYLSFFTTRRILAAHGLEVFDVEELPSHGGSLRVYAQHAQTGTQAVWPSVTELEQRERDQGYEKLETYLRFVPRVERAKRQLLAFLITVRAEGKTVACYGAPGKGNTLLNYCGIRGDLVEFAVDRNPYKHGRFTPGTHIPIHPPEALQAAQPDYVLILPWNLKREIAAQLEYVADWGGKLAVPIPELEIFDPRSPA
ncbi:MAG: class I SAM-dependent methyltransferase [bacterium]|nr:class I SAM-dependent methyltransferase [bacterium]